MLIVNVKVKYWVCVDFRRLNQLVTVGDAFPLPNITDILDHLGKSKIYYSTLDLDHGYHQVTMNLPNREKTAFSTDKGYLLWIKIIMEEGITFSLGVLRTLDYYLYYIILFGILYWRSGIVYWSTASWLETAERDSTSD